MALRPQPTRRREFHALLVVSLVAHAGLFAGLSAGETARAMDVTVRTVERRWRVARNRLFEELAETAPGN